MYPSIQDLHRILVQQHYITEEESAAAEGSAVNSTEYVAALIHRGVLSETLLGQALAEHYHVRFVDLLLAPPTAKDIQRIPEDIARMYSLIYSHEDEHGVVIATTEPTTAAERKMAALRPLFSKKKITFAYALPAGLEACFRAYEKPLGTRFSKIIQSSTRVAPEIVHEIMKDALGFRASDIHFEPHTSDVLVRFRIDGTLREAGHIPKPYYENILNRIKVESGMRIDEHLSAQDGSLQQHIGDETIDVRISIAPTIDGEKIAMRLLRSYVQGLALTDLGLDERHRATLENAARKPFGMILAVGPTGSGKTTTMYSLLKLLNRPDVNITSIEDPVEYKMTGVNQIPVRQQAGMTFARGLRSIVRQDPDIILVGEIRDQETADISVNAALTGHLLLSTFHANNAAAAIPRLIDMGIEQYLLASTLELIVAQRLVRTICMQCRYSLTVAQMLRDFRIDPSAVRGYFTPTDNVYAGKGCHACNGSGYTGRTAIFECIHMNQALQDTILHAPTAAAFAATAQEQGETTM
ncbi:MAG TPA: ATPase, T2SS/T4P/T4SS family [Candidatus Saccharimonadales bacterium]|nr:ATPase, T2SS/T4P/T4SS family [Candidatus Saccharimonadales bacterium]